MANHTIDVRGSPKINLLYKNLVKIANGTNFANRTNQNFCERMKRAHTGNFRNTRMHADELDKFVLNILHQRITGAWHLLLVTYIL